MDGNQVLGSSDYCSSIKADSVEGQARKNAAKSFASSICSADEKLFQDQQVVVQVSNIDSLKQLDAINEDMQSDIQRKSNSYLLQTFNPKENDSLKSSNY